MSSASSTATLAEPPVAGPSALKPSDAPQEKLAGSGTLYDPYVVEMDDSINPRKWSKSYRWFLSFQGSIQMFCVTLGTSAYTG